MALIKLIPLISKGDERGQLVSLESNRNIPFNIKRVYYIYNTSTDVRRGLHAHKHLEQVLVCTSGSCTVLLDDGLKKEIVTLRRPDIGLYIGEMTWREMYDFSPDCVLTVLASDFYNENDYIRNYSEFLNQARNILTV